MEVNWPCDPTLTSFVDVLYFFPDHTNQTTQPTVGSSYPKRKKIWKMLDLAVKSDVFQPKREETCKKHWKTSWMPKVDQFLVFCSTIWDVDVIARGVWSSGVAKKDLLAPHFPTEIYPFRIWEFLKIWMDIPHPVTDLCKPVNHTTSKWEHLEASHRQWGSLLGISLMIFPNYSRPSNNTTRILKVKRKKCLPDLHILTNVIYIYI